MRRPPRLPLALLGLALTAGAVIGFNAWQEQRLPRYVPPAVRHAPPPITDEVRLLALGDWGSADRPQAEVAWAMDRTAAEVGGVHAGLFLGDNFYNDGLRDVDDSQLRTTFEQVYDTPWLARITWYAVLGNHDYEGNTQAQIEYTPRSAGRWHMPREYHRVDLPNPEHPLVTLLALDTNRQFHGWDVQLPWLEAELKALVDAPQAVIAYGHHPLRSYSPKPGRVEDQMTRRVEPLFRRYPAVDLYLSGHAHLLELIVDNGLALAVLGGGGKRLHPAGDGPGSLFHLSDHGFGLLRVREDGVRLEIRDRDACVLYTWAPSRWPESEASPR